jgi:hypothetical protein
MSTDNTNIAKLESVAGELTDIIKQNSLAFQVCGVQYSATPTPLLFGVRKKAGTKGFEVLSVTPDKFTTGNSEGFSEEVIDDVFNLFGDDAVDYLRDIQANEIADAVDVEIVDFLNLVATVDTPITLDFTTGVGLENAALVQNLIVKINKTRLAIGNVTKRGFPSVIIASASVCSLLLSHKMISNDAAIDADKSRANVKYIGKIADADVYQDLNAASDYCMVTHKSHVPGDAGTILIPISEPKFAVRRDSEGAGFTHHFKQRFAYGQNPLDTASTAQVSTITFTNFDVNDTIEIGGIGGTPAAVTCTTDITTTVDLLVAEITGRTGETVVASNVGGVLTLTAIEPGVSFTATSTIVDLGAGAVTTTSIATPVVASDSDFTRKFDVTLTGYDAI